MEEQDGEVIRCLAWRLDCPTKTKIGYKTYLVAMIGTYLVTAWGVGDEVRALAVSWKRGGADEATRITAEKEAKGYRLYAKPQQRRISTSLVNQIHATAPANGNTHYLTEKLVRAILRGESSQDRPGVFSLGSLD